ncbi:hypothetical protein BCEN4_590078 [Burkholderia cenocepacia]|nr:hypothetical protein BCEN4_590078 [Burkholderia cenocepacia]
MHDRAANLQHPVDIVASRWQVAPESGWPHAPARPAWHQLRWTPVIYHNNIQRSPYASHASAP